MTPTPPTPPTPPPPPKPGTDSTQQRVVALRQRLAREGTVAVGMVEDALEALWKLDKDRAMRIRLRDDTVDNEEIAIEQECYELLALHRPFAHDFRAITFSLRVNADLERVADHASSICKVVGKIAAIHPASVPVPWPTALRELAARLPDRCHTILRAVRDEDAAAARAFIESDDVIDKLERGLFDETTRMVKTMGGGDTAVAVAMLTYRAGRELERIGDLTASVAEDLVYLATGEIIRHAKRRKPGGGKPS